VLSPLVVLRVNKCFKQDFFDATYQRVIEEGGGVIVDWAKMDVARPPSGSGRRARVLAAANSIPRLHQLFGNKPIPSTTPRARYLHPSFETDNQRIAQVRMQRRCIFGLPELPRFFADRTQWIIPAVRSISTSQLALVRAFG
jgi:hypothetical protein